jgi:hypothetical protein
MKKLFQKRTSISVGDSSNLAKASWPFGRVIFFEDQLVLEVGFKSYRLAFSEIRLIRFRTVQVQIEHRNPDVPEHVDLNGFLVSRSLRRAIQEHGLPLSIE